MGEDQQTLGAAILTGVVTAPVSLFVREMIRKADGSHAELRSWLKRKFHEARDENDDPADPTITTLLVVNDPDLPRSLIVDPNLPSHAIKALRAVDLDALFGDGATAVCYHSAVGCWRAVGT